MTVDPRALEDILSDLDLRLESSSRPTLSPGASTTLDASAATLVFVLRGELEIDVAATSTCAPSVDAAHRPGTRLRTGDVLLTADAAESAGTRPMRVASPAGAALVVARFRLRDGRGARALPPALTVSAFAEREPAVAALARGLGVPDPALGGRSGDPVICRLMVTTLVLAVVRAWATAGCAPRGWPATTLDPYLRCVLAAIHDDPGRDWSVEMLAALGTMSRTVFAERFRSAVGVSPAAYVTDVRIERARGLLASGRSVSETSRALGYSSDEGFSRAFRRRTGLAPSAWRAQRGAESEAIPA